MRVNLIFLKFFFCTLSEYQFCVLLKGNFLFSILRVVSIYYFLCCCDDIFYSFVVVVFFSTVEIEREREEKFKTANMLFHRFPHKHYIRRICCFLILFYFC